MCTRQRISQQRSTRRWESILRWSCTPILAGRCNWSTAANRSRSSSPKVANTRTTAGRLATISVLLVCFSVRAEVPTLDYLFPGGGQRGTTNSLTIGGKFDPWPPKVWVDSAGLHFEPQTNKGSFKVVIESEAKVGAHLIRIFNDDGASAPRWFVVGVEHEISEIETNDSWTEAQHIEALPITINGRLEKSGDVDSFAVRLEADKWLIATVDAYAIGSP